MISLSREYARRRVAFGKLLKDHPLHMQTIARMEVRPSGAELNLLARKEGRDPQLLTSMAGLPLCVAVRCRRLFLLQPDVCSRGITILQWGLI